MGKRTKAGRRARRRWHDEAIAEAALAQWACSPEADRRFWRHVERTQGSYERRRAEWDAMIAHAEALLAKYGGTDSPAERMEAGDDQG